MKKKQTSVDGNESLVAVPPAIQFTGEESQQKEILAFTYGVGHFTTTTTGMKGFRVYPSLAEGSANVGDYITRNEAGEIIVVPKEVYEAVDEAEQAATAVSEPEGSKQ